jgi:hypothetical protein
LQTPAGRKQLTDAMEMKRKWRQSQAHCDATFNTANVKTQFLQNADKVKLLTIVPIGLNNMCHINAELFCSPDIESVLGYNITSCPCGRIVSYELHSVNKIRGELVDFTQDFNDEPTKYFLPLNTQLKSLNYIRVFGKDPIMVEKRTCRCKIVWNSLDEYKQTTEQFTRHIKAVEGASFIH